MKPIIISNWKMNLNLSDAISLVREIENESPQAELLIAPPAPYLAYFAETFKKISICAQDISVYGEFGAYTGEYSAQIVKSCGIHYAIIGHSERRSLMFETNKIVKQKIENCIHAGIVPIICIGENLEARQNNSFREFLLEQIKSIPENAHDIIIAYEPVWAIGTGIYPNLEEINQVIELIRTHEQISPVAKNARLVYGGSVSGKNFSEIIQIPEISGVLIGSASLNKEELKSILNN